MSITAFDDGNNYKTCQDEKFTKPIQLSHQALAGIVENRNRMADHLQTMKTSTSFFFQNFPENIDENNLRRIFQAYGTVVDVFIPQKRDIANRKFGFVRFIRIINPAIFVQTLQNIWIGSYKARVSIAKYQPNHQNNGERNPLPTAPTLQPTKPSKIKMLSDAASVDLMQCFLVGVTEDFQALMNIPSFTEVEGCPNIEMRYLGGLKMLLEFEDNQVKTKFLSETEHVWKKWFKEMYPWDINENFCERIASILIHGLPQHAWCEEAFSVIASTWGKVIIPEECATDNTNLAYGRMDRDTWMYGLERDSNEYIANLKDFLKVAENNRVNKGENHIWCPCKLCQNCKMLYEVNEVEEHLIVSGFMNGYTRWSRHGELLIDRNMVDIECNDDDQTGCFEDDNNDKLDDMLHDIEDEVPDKDHLKFQQLFDDAEKPLYVGCTKFTKLSAVLKLMNLKATHGWSDKSFTDTLETLHEMLPDDNELPVSTYQAKKLMCPMGLEIERIHACPNDCMLYRDQYADLDKCVTCGTSRYKKKNETEVNDNVKKNGPAAKVLWYFPIIPRLKRLFANTKNAKLLRWHAEDRKKDGKIRHVADSPQWRNIDYEFKEFGDEIRNIRFGLSSDGINPFGNMSTQHSTWPVLLCIYNLPPWLCMKRKYIMMSLLIQGPKQPGNDIDVYLAPLIEDLKILWNSGVDVYDAYNKEYFRLRAMIFCTISDFPAYANLSGYSTKGKKACPVCENDTQSLWLENCKKVVYMGHRRSLPISHEYRQMGNLFDGTIEKGKGAHPITGRTSFSRVQNLNIVFGKSSKSGQIDNWKKRSIFWELPYWEKLDVRHCLDVMHIEKNVCESLIGLLLNIKSKDGLSVRKDMVKMGIRPELAPIEKDKKRTYLPPACYTLVQIMRQGRLSPKTHTMLTYDQTIMKDHIVELHNDKGTMGQPARKKRSVSMIKEKPKHKLVNLHIEFNELGQAIGKNRFEFTTYCGVTVKTRISILQCWNEVSEAEIDELWLNIKTHWNIPNDDYKAQVLKVCNQQWRTYKSKLLKFMDKGIDPLKEFPHKYVEEFHVESEPGIFGPARIETYIKPEVILEMLNREELDINCIIWYQMVLHSILATNGANRCAFINPQSITETECDLDDMDINNKRGNRVVNDIVDTMRYHQDKHFFLAPYWQSRHWLLLVICPYQRTGYILDSIKKSGNPLDRYKVISHVERAVATYNGTTEISHPMKWTFTNCNQQLSNWECGYYVMKWMREFVMYRQHVFPKNLWNDKNPISGKVLDEMVNTWMTTFERNYMK
ncbi:hypothetical protein LXL04_033434 [Taraxacum kok-saghyz]